MALRREAIVTDEPLDWRLYQLRKLTAWPNGLIAAALDLFATDPKSTEILVMSVRQPHRSPQPAGASSLVDFGAVPGLFEHALVHNTAFLGELLGRVIVFPAPQPNQSPPEASLGWFLNIIDGHFAEFQSLMNHLKNIHWYVHYTYLVIIYRAMQLTGQPSLRLNQYLQTATLEARYFNLSYLMFGLLGPLTRLNKDFAPMANGSFLGPSLSTNPPTGVLSQSTTLVPLISINVQRVGTNTETGWMPPVAYKDLGTATELLQRLKNLRPDQRNFKAPTLVDLAINRGATLTQARQAVGSWDKCDYLTMLSFYYQGYIFTYADLNEMAGAGNTSGDNLFRIALAMGRCQLTAREVIQLRNNKLRSYPELVDLLADATGNPRR
jgi:hypothetical protein